MNNTTIVVWPGVACRSWQEKETDIWRVPLVRNIKNTNTETVLVGVPLTDLLLDRPLPEEAVHNVYELQTVPEQVHYYYHACTGFPINARGSRQLKRDPSYLSCAIQKKNQYKNTSQSQRK